MGGVSASNTTNVTISDHSRFINNMAMGNGGMLYTEGGHIRVSDRNVFFSIQYWSACFIQEYRCNMRECFFLIRMVESSMLLKSMVKAAR